jgi:hypothetical protein
MDSPEELTTTIEVPAQHRDDFRLAALHELGDNAEWVKQQQQEASAAEDRQELDEYLLEAIGGPVRYLNTTVEVLRQLMAGGAEVMAKKLEGLDYRVFRVLVYESQCDTPQKIRIELTKSAPYPTDDEIEGALGRLRDDGWRNRAHRANGSWRRTATAPGARS